MGVGEGRTTCVFRSHPKMFHVEQLYIPFEIKTTTKLKIWETHRKNLCIPIADRRASILHKVHPSFEGTALPRFTMGGIPISVSF